MIRTMQIPMMLALVFTSASCGEFISEPVTDPDERDASVLNAEGIKVMSQNLYLGVDLGILLNATTEEDIQAAFQQLVTTTALDASNLEAGPRRLFDLAQQIMLEEPHLVGLQELSTFAFAFNDGSRAVLDFRTVIEGWLEYFYAMGYTSYTWQWLVNPLVEAPTLVLPVLEGVAVDYVDADAILIRSDLVPTLSRKVLGVFDAYETFSVLGAEFPYYRGWEAVTVEVGGQDVMFVNTHLEVQAFEDVQLAQAEELIAFMDAQSIPVIAVGDFNSAANHDAPADQYSGSYKLFRDAGYADIWLREAHSVDGATCCQAGDLTNAESQLDARLDLVLVDSGSDGFGGQTEMEVLGEEPGDRIEFSAVSAFDANGPAFPLALWPSDHAGVVATLWPAPGRRGE